MVSGVNVLRQNISKQICGSCKRVVFFGVTGKILLRNIINHCHDYKLGHMTNKYEIQEIKVSCNIVYFLVSTDDFKLNSMENRGVEFKF